MTALGLRIGSGQMANVASSLSAQIYGAQRIDGILSPLYLRTAGRDEESSLSVFRRFPSASVTLRDLHRYFDRKREQLTPNAEGPEKADIFLNGVMRLVERLESNEPNTTGDLFIFAAVLVAWSRLQGGEKKAAAPSAPGLGVVFEKGETSPAGKLDDEGHPQWWADYLESEIKIDLILMTHSLRFSSEGQGLDLSTTRSQAAVLALWVLRILRDLPASPTPYIQTSKIDALLNVLMVRKQDLNPLPAGFWSYVAKAFDSYRDAFNKISDALKGPDLVDALTLRRRIQLGAGKIESPLLRTSRI